MDERIKKLEDELNKHKVKIRQLENELHKADTFCTELNLRNQQYKNVLSQLKRLVKNEKKRLVTSLLKCHQPLSCYTEWFLFCIFSKFLTVFMFIETNVVNKFFC